MGAVRKAIRALAGVLLLIASAACGGGGGHTKPAERHLVYLYLRGISSGSTTVWIAGADGSNAHSLGRGSAAVLSPDGRSVALQRRAGIYIVSSRGTHARLVTRRRLHLQAWSPDGTTLIANRPKPLAVLELDAIDARTGRVRVIAGGSLYGFDFSPKGDELVYSRAPTATGQGPCGDQFDLYVTKVSGGTPTRLTRDGLSGFPVWGPSGIAFSRFPEGNTIEDCSAPGIWTMDSDGSHVRPVIARAPMDLASNQLFGLQPVAWLDDEHILAGIRTNAGTLGAVVDTRTRKLRQVHEFVDEVSSDSRFAVGSGGNSEQVHLAITRLTDNHRIYQRKDACCPDWNR
jgi:hypothetical protein